MKGLQPNESEPTFLTSMLSSSVPTLHCKALIFHHPKADFPPSSHEHKTPPPHPTWFCVTRFDWIQTTKTNVS